MTLPQNKSVLIAIGIAVAVSLWLISGAFNEKEVVEAKSVTQTAQTKTVKVLVSSQTAQDHANLITIYGQTQADREVNIKAETAGRISEVLVEKGATVKKGDIIARIAIDDRNRRLKSAEALVRQRQLEYEASRKLSQKSFRSQTKLAEAEALMHAARADLESKRLDLAHTQIKAPFDGKLEDKTVEVGDYVSQGSQIARIVDLSPIVITADMSENNISKVQDGQPAKAIISNGAVIDGIIRFVAKTSDNTTRTYRIEVEGENPGNQIAAGLTAQVRLEVGTQDAYFISPAIITLADNGVVGIKTVDANDIVNFHPIGLLEDTVDGIWVSGLPKQARIITRGQEYVSVGQKVMTVDAASLESSETTEASDLAKAQGN